ncbi:GyrI-like domain-containing protein [candidate division WOR-3 bacterium]|nr:GyrI-like domain-containing protein [candidate division WOR-3 bacterium]
MAEIMLKKVAPCKAVVIEGQGPYDKVGPIFRELFEWLSKKGLKPAGPSFGIYYDNPDEVPPEKCRYKICFPIEIPVSPTGGEIAGDERVKLKDIPGAEMACIAHYGSYSKIGPVWGKLCEWIDREGYNWAGPGREVYIKCPGMTEKEEELVTEIQIPVKKS